MKAIRTKRFTVTNGTCRHSTKAGSQNWISAVCRVLTVRNGVSGTQLCKELGCQHKTARHMLHRVLEACGKGEIAIGNVMEAVGAYTGGERLRHVDLIAGSGNSAQVTSA